MERLSSEMKTVLGRVVKVAMVLVVVPLAVGLLQGILGLLEVASVTGLTFREWVERGVGTYVALHLLLYRPVPLFRASHRVFSALAIWLFGGQVATVEGGTGVGKKGTKGKAPSSENPAAQGSTLVAFSPYAIPIYTVLVCLGGWLLGKWTDRLFVEGPVNFFVGVTIAFHWLMTADDLQQQRSRWHVETYLLALGLVFVLTLAIVAMCLPLTVPGFSFLRALAEGFSSTQAIYSSIFGRLFL